MQQVYDIIELMQDSPSDEELELITKAYNFAEKAHAGQKRYSGSPYFKHAYETAKILAKLGKHATTISAGLLHDVLEDTPVTEEELEKEFGKEITFLVEGVTKLGRLKYHGTKRHSESLRKLFVATSQDIRVIIIKLADRLHNMRTLQYVPEEKRLRIASETLEIYAPVAYRLGIRVLNRKLEDLAFSYVYPKEFKEIKALIAQKHKKDLLVLGKFHKSVKKALAKQGLINIHTEYRVKGIYSLYKKYLRKDKDLDKIYDIMALRVIVPTVDDCYKALGVIHSTWKPYPGRIKDYIASPKTNGYQCIHTTVFIGDGNLTEVQIKTEAMHKESEFGIASHVDYKENPFKTAVSSTMLWIKSLLPLNHNEEENDPDLEEFNKINFTDGPEWIKELAQYHTSSNNQEDFVKTLKNDFLKDRMFVFTPKGDVVDLPVGSTAIDFAYAIHSNIGDHLAGAKVNGKYVSLDKQLKNGDTVEIQTKKNGKPSRKWLEYAKTTNAQKRIKLALSEQ